MWRGRRSTTMPSMQTITPHLAQAVLQDVERLAAEHLHDDLPLDHRAARRRRLRVPRLRPLRLRPAL